VGTYSVDSSGEMTFTPEANFTGTPAALTYTVKDQFNQVASATYTPTVQAPPLAQNDTPAAGAYDVTQNITVLSNDARSSSTDSPFTVTTVKLCDPNPDGNIATNDAQVAPNCNASSVSTVDGTYTANANGTVTFDPARTLVTTVTVPVTYQVADGGGQVTSAVITPSVSLPALPTADAETTSGFKGVPQTISLFAGDAAAPNVTLVASSIKLCAPANSTPTPMPTPSPTGAQVSPDCSATSITVPGVGTYSVDAAGEMTFTPEANFTGTLPH
jgi:CshA-type fibril repeat protein